MTALGQVEAQSIRDQVYAKLERAIVEGTLRPNTVLSDRHLSEELGVSRTPIRDALHVLQSSGLVQRCGRVGWSVAGISPQDVEELFELRCLLEPAGIASIVLWDDVRLKQLTSMFTSFKANLDSSQIPYYLQVDDAFHEALCNATKNRRISHVYGIIRRQIHRIRQIVSYQYQGRAEQSLTEHLTLCDALARRDEKAAREALLTHLYTAKSKYAELCASFLEGEPSASA